MLIKPSLISNPFRFTDKFFARHLFIQRMESKTWVRMIDLEPDLIKTLICKLKYLEESRAATCEAILKAKDNE